MYVAVLLLGVSNSHIIPEHFEIFYFYSKKINSEKSLFAVVYHLFAIILAINELQIHFCCLLLKKTKSDIHDMYVVPKL